MRSFAKLLKENTQGGVQVTSVVPMDHAEISRDGLRAVDSGVFKVPSRIESNIGDEYKYIQDVADATHLRGAYLFQGSCLDESGYNNDPVNQVNNGISGFTDYDGLDYTLNITANNKFKGFYGATATANGDGAIIPNKFLKDGVTNTFDFSGDFDIFCWVVADSSSGSSGTIFSKTNSSTEGVRISLNKTGSQYFANAYIHTTNTGNNDKSFSTTGNDGGSASYVQADKPCLIRLQRKGITFNLWLVNGSESTPFGSPNGTYTGTASYPRSPQDLFQFQLMQL